MKTFIILPYGFTYNSKTNMKFCPLSNTSCKEIIFGCEPIRRRTSISRNITSTGSPLLEDAIFLFLINLAAYSHLEDFSMQRRTIAKCPLKTKNNQIHKIGYLVNTYLPTSSYISQLSSKDFKLIDKFLLSIFIQIVMAKYS